VVAARRALARPPPAGASAPRGLVGRVATPLAPEGRVFVRGEYWAARGDEELPAGEAVEVTGVEGMRLRVRRAAPER
jgi:membrane-bound serine protease (ClpP class)